jgi:hypothetical protein
MVDGRCHGNPDSESQDRNARNDVECASSHRISCRFSFLTDSGLDRLLSQSYSAERALGHSSRFAKAASA